VTDASDEAAWVAPAAQIFGAFRAGAGTSIWPHCVVRAEAQHVRVGRLCNLQDFVMLHAGYDDPVEIGDFCSITHHATVHGARVGDACLIGIGAVLMDGAEVGAGSIVAGGAVLSEGKHFPAGSVIAGVPAKVIAERDSRRANRLNAWLYHRNALAYAAGEHRAWSGSGYRAWRSALESAIESDADLDPAFDPAALPGSLP